MSDIQILSEPHTYRRDAPASFFRDLALATQGRDDTGAARERLERHRAEMAEVLDVRERRAVARLAEEGIETRAHPTRASGQGGSFTPPLWLIEDAGLTARPGRVLSSLIPRFDLPSGVGQVNLPRLTTGSQELWTGDGSAVTDRDYVDYSATSPVVTIAGDADVALQLLEQSPPGPHLDFMLFRDLMKSFHAHEEAQLIYGNGSPAPNGQIMGLLNVPTGAGGANSVTYTDASPTAAKMYPYLGQVAAQIGNARLMPPEVWLMRTSRWAWLGTGEDSSGMPLSVPAHAPPPPIPYLLDDERPTPVSAMLGWPIYPLDLIPGTLNSGTLTGGTQDAIIGCRPSDMILLESAMTTSVFLEVLSGTLSARLQARAYVAAIVAREPTGIGFLTGTGMTVQPNF